jgi:hypothetical protein
VDTQRRDSPLLNTIYTFRTVTLAGSHYNIENRTPYTLYVTPKAVAQANDVIRQASLTILPFNRAVLGYIAADYVNVVLSTDVAQIVLPEGVSSFISFTTLQSDEIADEISTAGTIATYNPASLEINALSPASQVLTPSQSGFLPASGGIDLFGWNGCYFQFACGGGVASVLVQIVHSADSAFTIPLTSRVFCSNQGVVYVPRLLRYVEFFFQASPDWTAGSTFNYNVRRTVEEIYPHTLFLNKTINWSRTYSVAASAGATFYVPCNPPVTRVGVFNKSGVVSRLRQLNTVTMDGTHYAEFLSTWMVQAGQSFEVEVETSVAFWLQLSLDGDIVPTPRTFIVYTTGMNDSQ